MSYIRLDTTIARNVKFLRASGDAKWLWLQGIMYCQDAKTDGFIHGDVLLALGVPVPRPEWADELVAARLWDRVEGGYLIHDYLDCNDSKEKREQIRLENRRRKAEFDQRQRGLKVIDVVPEYRRIAEPETPPVSTPDPAPVSAPVERGRPLVDSPIRQAGLDARYGFIGPRFRVPAAFHQELVGRYGGDMVEAEAALQKWYRGLEASLLQGESIPNIYEFINKHFAAWVAKRSAPVPAAPTAKRADDQRQGVTDDFRAQLEAAQARKSGS